jgi:hypothetical protein
MSTFPKADTERFPRTPSRVAKTGLPRPIRMAESAGPKSTSLPLFLRSPEKIEQQSTRRHSISTPSPKIGNSSLTLNAGHTPHPGSNQLVDEDEVQTPKVRKLKV